VRRKREAVLPFASNDDALPKTVREYREKYKGISRLWDKRPEILNRLHEDLKKLSDGGRRGRSGDFTFLDKCMTAIRPKTWRRGERSAGPEGGRGRANRPERRPHRHHGDRCEHPLADRLLAAVGHLAGRLAPTPCD